MFAAAQGSRSALVEAAVYAVAIDGLGGAAVSAIVGVVLAGALHLLRPSLTPRRAASLQVATAASTVLLVVGLLWAARAHGAGHGASIPTATVAAVVMLAVAVGAFLAIPARGFAPGFLASAARVAVMGFVGCLLLAILFPIQVIVEARHAAEATRYTPGQAINVDVESLGDGIWYDLDRTLSAPHPTRNATADGMNVMLITVDALRADHLGACGNDWISTPWIDEFARHGAISCMTYPQQPQTNPSLASLFTSTYPAVHGVRVHMVDRLSESFDTLAKMLARNGFTTAGIIPWTSLEPAFSGFQQGFHTYEAFVQNEPETLKNPSTAALAGIYRRVTDQLAVGSAVESVLGLRQGTEAQIDGRADVTASAAVNWLANHGQEHFFLWVHFFDPHYPFTPPSPWDELYPGARDYDGPYDGSMQFVYEMREGVFNPTPRDVEYLHALYAGEVSYADHYIGQVLGYMAEQGILDNTIVMLTADHGEGLGERGDSWPEGDYWLHGDDVYDPGTRVAWIIFDPRSKPAGPLPPVPLQSIDITPTILDLLGLPIPAQVQGRSIVPILKGTDDGEDRYAIVTLGDDSHTAIISAEGWKLHVARKTGERELYDLRADPGERVNLAAAHPTEVNALLAQLDRWALANQQRMVAGADGQGQRGGS